MTTRQPQPWTPERHAALKALDAAAIPGPFVEVNRGEIAEADPARRVARDPHLGEALAQVAGNLHIRDAEALARFFAAARDDVPNMLAEIERLTDEANEERAIAKARMKIIEEQAATIERLKTALADAVDKAS